MRAVLFVGMIDSYVYFDFVRIFHIILIPVAVVNFVRASNIVFVTCQYISQSHCQPKSQSSKVKVMTRSLLKTIIVTSISSERLSPLHNNAPFLDIVMQPVNHQVNQSAKRQVN